MLKIDVIMKIMEIIDSIDYDSIKENDYISICSFLKELHDKYLIKNKFKQKLSLHEKVLYRYDHLTLVWCTIIAINESFCKYRIKIDATSEICEVDQFDLYKIKYQSLEEYHINKTIPHQDIQTHEKIKVDAQYLKFMNSCDKIKYKDKIKALKSLPQPKFFQFTLFQKEQYALQYCTRDHLNIIYVYERNNRCKKKQEYIEIKKKYLEIIGNEVKLCFD